MDAKVFGQFIAQTRKEKNMTQADLASQINVTDKAVSRWERGLGFPDISTLEPLAKALDLSMLELMRSKKEDVEKMNDLLTEQELTELMNHAVEMNTENARQDRISVIIAIAVTLIVGGLFWGSGHANLLGGLLAGAIAAVAVVSLYLYTRNLNDKIGRRIYGGFMLGGVSGVISLMRMCNISDSYIEWMLFYLLCLLVIWSNPVKK